MRQADGRDIYTVAEVNYFARETLEQMTFFVEGEISSLKKNPAWSFYYLDLKDDKAVLPCIASGHLIEALGGELSGQRVIAFGYLSLYEPIGKYQLRIQKIEAAGEGLLAKKLEELIRKLRAEGLFDEKYKKKLPLYPKKVCLVTSQGSDAYNDFKTHSIDKFPIIELYTADIRVQGFSSVADLLAILPKVDEMGFDIAVITRGGGSLEDLAAFNDEQTARAIFKMKTPTLVAIGHESNESLAEWVADRRASTPTDAANIVVNGYMQVLTKLETLSYKFKTTSNYIFTTNFQRLDQILVKLDHVKDSFRDLPHRLNTVWESMRRHEKYFIADAVKKTDDYALTLKKTSRVFIENKERELAFLYKSLFLLSPKNTLKRGYSITRDAKGKILSGIADVVLESTIDVRLSDGHIESIVKSKSKI